MLDNDGRFALTKNAFKIDTKPHGHGDIHTLLYQNKVAEKWQKLGKEWMVFIQDTNALAMRTIPTVLGVSRKNNWEMNSIAIPRKPGESIGAICKLIDQSDSSKEVTINVEYNQLEALLKAKWDKGSDVPNEQGLSYFPGNTNTLIFKIPEYVQTLEKTKGVIPEFVNPKYADESRTVFKAPTRLECMMQDYPKLLTNKGTVGFTTYDAWFCFSPVKNKHEDACKLYERGLSSHGAAQAEWDYYNWTNKVLSEQVGVDIDYNTEPQDFNGMKLAFGPKIVLDPSFAISVKELRQKFQGKTRIGRHATLILEGLNTTVADLHFEGGFKRVEDEQLTGEINEQEG